MVLGQDPGSGPCYVDAADWEDLGVSSLCQSTCPVRFDKEAYSHSACSIVRVPSHFGQQFSSSLLLIDGRHEANPDPSYLYLPADLEHRPLHSFSGQLFSQTASCAGHFAWNWQHVSGSGQLHHVCAVHSAHSNAPLQRSVLLLLQMQIQSGHRRGRRHGTGPYRKMTPKITIQTLSQVPPETETKGDADVRSPCRPRALISVCFFLGVKFEV